MANGSVGEKADERSEWPRRAVEQPEQGDGPGPRPGAAEGGGAGAEGERGGPRGLKCGVVGHVTDGGRRVGKNRVRIGVARWCAGSTCMRASVQGGGPGRCPWFWREGGGGGRR